MKELKPSEIISNSCCGALLDIPVLEMVKKVESLENEIAFLENQLENAQKEIKRLSNG